MEFIKTSKLSEKNKLELLKLWNNEYPKKLNFNSLRDFDKYLNQLDNKNHILLIDENKLIIGWFMDFIRDKEKWFGLILASKVHRKGLGKKILNIAKENKDELNGWVIVEENCKKKNLEFYKSPINFYLKNDFEKLPNERKILKDLSAVKIKWRSIL